MMTKGERADLARLVRQRERAAKHQAEHRSAELLAEFERQISREYRFDQRPVWKAAHDAAAQAVQAARSQIAAECRRLGIPPEFAPDLSLSWWRRGENAFAERRAELRRVAQARIKEREQMAKAEIERVSLDVQAQLVSDGLTSDAAKAFLARLPEVAALMPPLDVKDVHALLPAPDLGQGDGDDAGGG
jgi:hypothetical protein